MAGVLTIGCAHRTTRLTEAQQVGLTESKYDKLRTKALAGDKKAAETLSKLWYQHEYGSSEHAIYWAQIAAQNGSKRAGQALKYARERVDADAVKIPE